MANICMVVGAGPGIGLALGKKWALEGYKVALVSRTQSKVDDLASQLGENAVGFAGDCTSAEDMAKVVAAIEKEFSGTIKALMYNAGNGVWDSYENIDMDKFDQSMKTNVHGLLILTKLLAPKMIQSGGGSIGITGATASLRGKPFTTGFAPAKGAQRLLAQSLARDLAPKGIHVYLMIIDGLVYSKDAHKRNSKLPLERFIQPDAIAESFWHVSNQHASCWSFEVDVRSNVSEW